MKSRHEEKKLGTCLCTIFHAVFNQSYTVAGWDTVKFSLNKIYLRHFERTLQTYTANFAIVIQIIQLQSKINSNLYWTYHLWIDDWLLYDKHADTWLAISFRCLQCHVTSTTERMKRRDAQHSLYIRVVLYFLWSVHTRCMYGYCCTVLALAFVMQPDGCFRVKWINERTRMAAHALGRDFLLAGHGMVV